MTVLLDLARHFPISWRMVRRCRIPTGELGEPYYVSFEPGGGVFGEQWNAFDAEGVLFKGAYNPVSIAQYALHCYDRFLAGDGQSKESFLTQARYLRAQQNSEGAYVYGFAHPPYGLRAGWISCLAQGEAASVLFRAYAVTRDETFLQAALRSLEPFTRDVGEGGVSFIRGNDVFFEEVAGCPTHILNGHISGAFALWEASRYGFASAELEELHQAAITTLVRWLPLYDGAGWSFYQLAQRGGRRHFAPITYHQAHVNLLHVYAAMTGRREFEDMSVRWRRAMEDPAVRLRVWADGARWISGAALARLRRLPVQPWEPMRELAQA